jgi:hypothetical protein
MQHERAAESDVEPIDLAGLRRALVRLEAAGLSERDRVEFCADALSRAQPRRSPAAEDRSGVPSPSPKPGD